MADLKTDVTSQKNSCQSSNEDASCELPEKEEPGLVGGEPSSKENPSLPSTSKSCPSTNSFGQSNAWPYFKSCAPGNSSLSNFRDSRSSFAMAPSKFSSSPSSGTGLSSSKPVLRPSQLLGSSTFTSPSPFNSKGAYSLSPSRLGNPFAK
ncbi:hypothetical protein J437_LFUL013483, partial [Ladona fulva]